MNKIVSEEPDLLGAVVTDAQNVVNSAERYVAAAQALKDHITSLIAGPCPKSKLRQGTENCIAYSSANLRDAPNVNAHSSETLSNTRVIVYTKSNNSGTIWYYVEVNDAKFSNDTKRGWIGIEPTFDPTTITVCNELPEVPLDADFSSTEPGFSPGDCSQIPASGCVEIRGVAILSGGSRIRTQPSAPYPQSGEQEYGREVGRLLQGVFFYDAIQPDIDGCWYRLTTDSGAGFWVKDFWGGEEYLTRVENCTNARHLNEDDFELGELPEFKVEPCAFEKANKCPRDDAQAAIEFILQCESGGDPTSAVSIANVILNRMIATGRSAFEVVTNGEFTCVCGSDVPVVPGDLVKKLAVQLSQRDPSIPQNVKPLNMADLPILPQDTEDIPPEIGRALYTVGIRRPESVNRDNLGQEGSITAILNAVYDHYRLDPAFDRSKCHMLYGESGDQGELETAHDNLHAIYVGATLRPGGEYMTAYFTNDALIAICKSF